MNLRYPKQAISKVRLSSQLKNIQSLNHLFNILYLFLQYQPNPVITLM